MIVNASSKKKILHGGRKKGLSRIRDEFIGLI